MFPAYAEIVLRRLVLGGLLAAMGAGCSRTLAEPHAAPTVARPATASHTVEIRQPPLPRLILTGVPDAHGAEVGLHCVACHSVRPADMTTAETADLDEFHQGLKMAHGRLTCGSCHQPRDGYASLKLADNRSLPFEESMTLCAQCHGTQFRDYQHGAHGGMQGYWDLTRGGRTRNHCLHCHDAHAPKYPTLTPAAAPRDRFAPVRSGDSHD